MGGRELPEGALRDPRSGEIYHETLDDAGKCTMWEGYWDQEDPGMNAALGAVMAKMPKPE